MRLYHASMKLKVLLKYHSLFPHKRLKVLRSFGMLGSEEEAFCMTHRDKIDGLILDSGTWTLNKAEAETRERINLKSYIDYVSEFGHLFDFYFNFDSNFTDDGFDTNIFNQKRMEDAGLNPVPVVHNIYSDEIDYYIKQQYPIVALGSSQIKRERDLKNAMDRFKGTGIDIHLFGNTTFDYLASFPLFSCDSTMWALTGAYGFINYWNPKKEGRNKRDKIYMEEFLSADKKERINYSDYRYRGDLDTYLFETLGVTDQDLLGHDGPYYKELVNTHYYVRLEEIVNQIHQEEGFDSSPESGS